MNAVVNQFAGVVRNGKTYLLLFARCLMSSLFIWDAALQLRNPIDTAQYFTTVHVPLPDLAVWVSIAIHLLGGLALLVGFEARWAAALLALLCLGTAFGVHLPMGDQANIIHFYKNLVMMGGFLYVMACGAGNLGVDREAEYKRKEIAVCGRSAVIRKIYRRDVDNLAGRADPSDGAWVQRWRLANGPLVFTTNRFGRNAVVAAEV